jgi:hypothetical protein
MEEVGHCGVLGISCPWFFLSLSLLSSHKDVSCSVPPPLP